ncbi:class I SAM-dependent methyltransferase [Halococcus saccharolyticus]
MAARLVEATNVSANDTVLDVGCGTGNVAITTARRGASATGLDITPALLDYARGRKRSMRRPGVQCQYDRGDTSYSHFPMIFS